MNCEVEMCIFEMQNTIITLKVKLMIKKELFVLLIIMMISCKSSNHLTLYKDKEIFTTPVEPTSINSYPWKLKSHNVFDIKVFKGKREKQLYSIINNLETIPNTRERMGFPRYAFLLDYNNKKDTLYCYDFNDEHNYKNEMYLVQNDITLQDTNNELKNFIFKNYEKFIRKEYYTLPGKKKERYWIKEDDF